jgi:hypothetical protein
VGDDERKYGVKRAVAKEIWGELKNSTEGRFLGGVWTINWPAKDKSEITGDFENQKYFWGT